MRFVPSRAELANLIERAQGVAPAAVCGFVRIIDDERVAVLYVHRNGAGEYIIPSGDLPPAMLPAGDTAVETEREAPSSNPEGVAEGLLQFMGAARVVALRLSGLPPATFWMGLSEASPLSAAQRRRFADLSQTAATVLTVRVDPDEAAQQLLRLERTADMLPALLHGLDVRQAFDRLSGIANASLPHDHLVLRLFSPDSRQITVYAQSHGKALPDQTVANTYAEAPTRAWEFAIIDDLTLHAVEANQPLVQLGAKSTVRVPIRFDDRQIGGLAFLSSGLAKYTTADVAVARRLADYVAVALSHQRLADEQRLTSELQAKAGKLDLLDEVLATVLESGELREVFARVSEVTGKVIAHDALVLAIRVPGDNGHVRLYASTAPAHASFPDLIPVAPVVRANPKWEFEVVDDLQAESDQGQLVAAQRGIGASCGCRCASTTRSPRTCRSCRSNRRNTPRLMCRSRGASAIGLRWCWRASAARCCCGKPTRRPNASRRSRRASRRSPRCRRRKPIRRARPGRGPQAQRPAPPAAGADLKSWSAR